MIIKPCPFCGTEAECIEAMNESWCRCLNKHCLANGPVRMFKRNAILKWNERVPLRRASNPSDQRAGASPAPAESRC